MQFACMKQYTLPSQHKGLWRRHTVVIGHNGLDVLQLAQVPELHGVPSSRGQEVAIL